MIGFVALCSLISFIAGIVIFSTAKSDIREIEGFALFFLSVLLYMLGGILQILRDSDEFRAHIKTTLFEMKNYLISIDHGVHRSERKITDTDSKSSANNNS